MRSIFSTISPSVRSGLLEGNDAPLLKLRTNALGNGSVLDKIDGTTENFAQSRLKRIEAAKMRKALFCPIELNDQIHIAALGCVATRGRSDNRQALDAAAIEFLSVTFQQRNNLFKPHDGASEPKYSFRAAASQFHPRIGIAVLL